LIPAGSQIIYYLEQQQMQRNFVRAATCYDDVAVLQREVAARMLERLELLRLYPEIIADIGCGTGCITTGLLKKYRKARIFSLDITPAMLHVARRRGSWLRRPYCVCADAQALPLADTSCDMLLSNLMLHWCNEPDRVFAEFRRVLRPNGVVLFSTLGPDTLIELRQSWAAVDDYPHVHSFIDMHDIGDALLRAQLIDPVMDTEYFTLTYQTVAKLLRDLKQTGAGNAATGRFRGLTGKGRLQKMIDVYEQRRRDGVLPATYEIVYGHAWAPAQALATKQSDDTAVFPLSRLRRPR
jgi:malonyl-CoA O-methyltransferase